MAFRSVGRGTPDVLSDLDLWVIVADESIEAVIAERNLFVQRVAPAMFTLDAPQNAPPGGAYLLALYRGDVGPQQIDWYWHPQTNASRPRESHVLFDRIGVPFTESLSPTDDELIRQAQKNATFFWAMSLAAKQIARGHSWKTITTLSMLAQTYGDVAFILKQVDDTSSHNQCLEIPPMQQVTDQMTFLRKLVGEMNSMMRDVARHGGNVPSEISAQIERVFEVGDALIEASTELP